MNEESTDRVNSASLCFLKYYKFVSMVAFDTVPLWQLQEDIVQEVYLEFVGKSDRWDFNVDLKPILRVLTRNIAVNVWREYSKNLPSNLREIANCLRRTGSDDQDSGEHSDYDKELMALESCIEKLTPRCRALIEAFYKEQRTMVEIAETQGERVNTIHKRLSRIRMTLRQCIERRLRRQ